MIKENTKIRNFSILLKLLEIHYLRVISFDIFDTLIFRPAIKPQEIFIFLNKYYTELTRKPKNNIEKLRINCENELINEIGIENVTLDLIYERLGKKMGISKSHLRILKEKEVSLEISLAKINIEMLAILRIAKEAGKRIILTSDMYLTSPYIIMILNKFAIDYDALYISADLRKRKDNGSLFDEIIAREQVLPSEILHIGDNENSDYLIPLKRGIIAFHYTPFCLMVKNYYSEGILSKINGITSIFLGYLFNEESILKSEVCKKYTSLFDFAYYSLGPLLLAMTLYLLSLSKIQKKYDTLLFSSRDGYLPLKVYEILRNAVGYGIPGKYIYCGRRSLSIANYNDNPIGYLTTIYNEASRRCKNYTVKDLFELLKLEKYYSEPVRANGEIKDYISDLKVLSFELSHRKIIAGNYFNELFNKYKTSVIFDCGYNGSSSDCIYQLTNKRSDKIFMWETRQNRAFDKINHTRTFLYFNNHEMIKPFHLLFEELFSPLESTCIGYQEHNGTVAPIFDTGETFSDAMKQDLTTIHNGVFDYVVKFCQYFGTYLPYIGAVDYQVVFDYTMQHLFNEHDESLNLLHNIVFPDKFYEGNSANSLSDKLCIYNKQNSFKGNTLINPEYLHINKYTSLPANITFKVGIHIHIYYIDLCIDFLERLRDFPCPFDLYITISDASLEKMIFVYFSPEIIPYLQKLTVIVVQNRGRDIAPWLIEMKNIQMEYDLFGHFHTKKNAAIGFGEEWRKYLLDNLLNRNAVVDILNLFLENTDLGLVYPPVYKDTYNAFTSVGDPPFQELPIIQEFLGKLGLPQINNCNEILFCAGSMFWYRPQALKKLFYENLTYEDFPEEPIGINGTLAHAIERLPSYVASLAGFETKLYVTPKALRDAFYSQYQNPQTKPKALSSTLKSFGRKTYFLILGLIPGQQLKKNFDFLMRKKLYPVIKKYLR